MNRRRVTFGAGIALVVVVSLVAATLLALPAIVRWVAVSQLAKATGRTVTLDGLELSVLRGRLTLRGLRVIDRDGGPLLTLERADVRFSPGALLRLRGHVREAAFHALTLRVVRTGPAQFNVSDLFARRAEKGGQAPVLAIDRLALTGSSIVIEDRTLTPPRTWRVDPLEVHARGASTDPGAPPGEATLVAVAAGSPITLSLTEVRLSPLTFKANLAVHQIDASLAALYLPPRSPLIPARGTLDVASSIERGASGETRVALDATFGGIELRHPGQASAYLTAPAVRVSVENLKVGPTGRLDLGRLTIDGGSMMLEDVRLQPAHRWQIEGIALEARDASSARDAAPGIATVRATSTGARLDVWATGVRLAPLALQATVIVRNVDLSLVQLYLPPTLPVRPERGIVNATVRVNHDARSGTHLGLDVGLANIDVERPGHSVAAPAVRVIAEDITLDGGALAIGRATVTSERLTVEERAARPPRTWPVRDVVIEAKDLSTRRDALQGVASLRAAVGNATASVFVTGARLSPLTLHATAILRGVDAALLRLYLPEGVPVELRRGVVNATVEIGETAEGTRLHGDATLTGLQAQGRGAFETLSVTAPSVRLIVAEGRRQGSSLSVGRVELEGAGTLSDARGPAARFEFSRIHLNTEELTWPVSAPARVTLSMRFQDRGELDGSGTARLTAPLPAVNWAAELGLKFRRVDLAPLAAYVPAAAGLGGRVRADVTAALEYAGALKARVRGDVGGARFALEEGGQPLLSLRSIAASGLDLEWPERLRIQRVHLREPYARVVRDREGGFPLAALARPGRSEAPARAAATAPSRAVPSITVDEVVVEDGRADFVDEGASPPVRVDLPKVSLTARHVTWPATAPVTLALEGTFPSGGTLKVDGTATAEPLGVDLTVTCQDADLLPLQPYLGFRARVGGRLSAALTVAGQLSPSPRVKITGDAGLTSLDISDGQRSVLTADRLRVTGIDADWPTRVRFDRVRLRRSWAQIERDTKGRFLLRTLFERLPEASRPSRPAAPAPTPSPAPAAPFEFSFREAIFDEQAATIVDGVMNPPVRLEVAGARLAVHDFSLPERGPAKVELKSPMPGGGQLEVAGTVRLDPMRLEARAVLDAVALDPLQPYVSIEGRVAGKVTGDLSVTMTLDPTLVGVKGQARLQAFRLNDGDRPVVTVSRLETSGIDVEWPRRIALQSVTLRRPRLLIERDEQGEFRLRQLVTPHWGASTPATAGPAPAPSSAAAAPRPAAAKSTPMMPTIEIGTLTLEQALARFVDYTTEPDYAEEVEDANVTFAPLSTAPGRPTRFSVTGTVGGGSLKLQGEGTWGARPVLDMTLDIRNYVVARADPYLALYTGWAASNGSLDVKGVYTLAGTRLETRHDVLVRGLQVAPLDERDEVARRVGLPFGMLVSLLKDSRGEIKLSLPVSGDVGTRQFDYKDALWASVRNLAIRLMALPFSKIGSLLYSADSKVTAVMLAPVVFEAGTDRLGPGMDPHLDRIAGFLRDTPAVKAVLEPILIEADGQALGRAQLLARLAGSGEGDTLARARREYTLRWPDRPLPETLDATVAELAKAETLPPDALQTLATRRIDAVRQRLTREGIDPARLPGSARRTPLVEAAGKPRVELDLRS